MTKMLKMAIGAAAAVAFGISAASAATVVNGSFEQDPGFNGLNGSSFDNLAATGGANWDIFASLPGWTVDAGDGIELQTEETIPLEPFDGDYYAELDGNQNSTISQMITLALGKYVLSFAYSPRENTIGTNGISYGIAGLVSGLVDGPSAVYPIGQWRTVTANFTVTTAGKYKLFFDAAGDSESLGGFVDAIEVSAVPVPAAGFLLIGALGGLAALRRRKTV